MDAVIVTEGESYELPDCGFTAPDGKEFDGWNLGAVGDVITITADTTITAQWEDKTTPEPEPVICTITFDANGGTGRMNPVTVEAGESYTLPECEFKAPAGKVFAGWDLGEPGDSITVTESTVITAQWKDAAPSPIRSLIARIVDLTLTILRSIFTPNC